MENIIRKALWDKVFTELHTVCKSIIPKEETRLPTVFECNTNKFNIYTYLFVIDRFLTSTIIPNKYEVDISTSIQNTTLSAVHRKSFEEIKNLFEKGDPSINYRSKGFVPNSQKNYFRASGNKYVKDFSSSIWGIRHLHLNPSNKDNFLLYYVIVKSRVYFIKIGNHEDLYKKDILEILVNEFPETLDQLGIVNLSELIPSDHEYSPEEVKGMWIAGYNILHTINGRCYSSCNLMLTNTLSIRFSPISRNISDQIENLITLFMLKLANIEYNELMEFEICRKIDEFTIKWKGHNLEQKHKISYFETVEFAKKIHIYIKEPKQK